MYLVRNRSYYSFRFTYYYYNYYILLLLLHTVTTIRENISLECTWRPNQEDMEWKYGRWLTRSHTTVRISRCTWAADVGSWEGSRFTSGARPDGTHQRIGTKHYCWQLLHQPETHHGSFERQVDIGRYHAQKQKGSATVSAAGQATTRKVLNLQIYIQRSHGLVRAKALKGDDSPVIHACRWQCTRRWKAGHNFVSRT